MTTLKVGIADYETMKEWTMKVVRGELRPGRDDPKIWFNSLESLAKVLSSGNRELLNTIAESSPESIDDLARLTGRAKPNLSRALKEMAEYGLVEMEQEDGLQIRPKVLYDHVTFDLPLVRQGSDSINAGTRERPRAM